MYSLEFKLRMQDNQRGSSLALLLSLFYSYIYIYIYTLEIIARNYPRSDGTIRIALEKRGGGGYDA